MHFDYIEIGTSDFQTEVQKKENIGKIGLSIDPVSHYLSRLPEVVGNKKINIAISDKCGEAEIFYLPENVIVEHRLPEWVKGCNMIGRHHPTVCRLLQKAGLCPNELFVSNIIQIVDMGNLAIENDITSIGYLKIDTEGHDEIIMNNYSELLWKRPELKAQCIRFERIFINTKTASFVTLMSSLMTHGYIVQRKEKSDYVLILNSST